MREVSGLLESESYGPAASLSSGPGSSLAHVALGGGTTTVSSGRQWILARIATRTMAPLAPVHAAGPSSVMQGGRLFPAPQVDGGASGPLCAGHWDWAVWFLVVICAQRAGQGEGYGL